MGRLARLGTIAALILGASGCSLGATLDPDLSDAGPDADRGGAIDSGPPPAHETQEERAVVGSCYDGVDNDGDADADCDDASCTSDPVCCVGSAAGDCCVPEDALTMTVPAGTCDGFDARDCTALEAGLTYFGAFEPAIEDGALVPRGGAGYGGVALGGPLDPRRLTIALEAQVHVPEVRCADCVDVAGIAFVDALPEDGQPARIRLGILASGSREEVIVVVGDEPVQRLALVSGALSLRIELDVHGDARLVVGEDGAGEDVVPLAGLEVPPRLHAVVVGRTDGREPAEPAVAVRGASLERSTCDVPGALNRHGQVLPGAASSWRPASLGRPSVAVAADTGQIWAAFEHEGAIRMASAGPDGQLSDPSEPVVGRPSEVARAFDPWLMADGDRFVLFFAGADADGVARIYRAEAGEGWDRTFGAPVEVLGPGRLDAIASLDGPTVWTDGGGERMIARALTVQGQRALVAFERRPFEGAMRWELAEADLESSIVHAPGADLFAIDRDEVAAPAVVVATGPGGSAVWRLYYGARRGTRWSIGLLVSEDGTAWRDTGAVLEGSGAGFDALGVADPAPVALDGDVRLYYRGWDGARSAFGRAGPAGTMSE